MGFKGWKDWKWYTWFTALMLFAMLVGWFGWWRESFDDKGWQVTWWIGWSTLFGHFMAGITD